MSVQTDTSRRDRLWLGVFVILDLAMIAGVMALCSWLTGHC